MRLTKQRQVILDQLKKHKDHPGADVIYTEVRQILPRISLGTVYRNLEILSEAEVVSKLEYGSGQKRFDPDPLPHPHFRCLSCGKVEDVPVEVKPPRLDDEDSWVSARTISGAYLEYTGLCPECSPEKM
jgi:Fur family ferric uptake transcriptional regulator